MKSMILLRSFLGLMLVMAACTAQATPILQLFSTATAFNQSTGTTNDAAIGITGYTIDDFETTTLLPGLNISLSGGQLTSPITWTVLPNLSNGFQGCGNLAIGPWDGSHYVANTSTNLQASCTGPINTSKTVTFNYAPGTTSFGIGLANFQSVSPASPDFPITNHELFVNGVDMGTVDSLANWSPGIVRNGYLLINSDPSDPITSVEFVNNTAVDYLVFDHLAVQGASMATPEPGTFWLLVAAGIPGIKRLFGNRLAARQGDRC